MTTLNPAGPEAVPVARPIPKPRTSNRTANLLLGVAAAVAVGGLAFAGGRLTAGGSTASVAGIDGLPQAPTGSFVPAADGPMGGAGAMTVSGTVASTDGSTMTITTADGSTVSIDLSGAAYHAQADAEASDLAVGDSVSVSITSGLRAGDAGGAASASADPGSSTLTATDVTITSH